MARDVFKKVIRLKKKTERGTVYTSRTLGPGIMGAQVIGALFTGLGWKVILCPVLLALYYGQLYFLILRSHLLKNLQGLEQIYEILEGEIHTLIYYICYL